MTVAADLKIIQDNLIAILKIESASPRPNYSIDGRSVSWNDYRKSLLEEITNLTSQISDLSPYIIPTKMVV